MNSPFFKPANERGKASQTSHSPTRPHAQRLTALPWTGFFLLATAALIQTACPGGADMEPTDDMGAGGTGTGGNPDGAGGSPPVGAGGSDSTGAGGSAPAACDVTPYFSMACNDAICHGTPTDGEPSPGGIDLESPGLAARMYDVDATYPTASGCPTPAEKLIDPAGAEQSLLYKKLARTHSCGMGMPSPGILPVNPTDVECVKSWIEDVIANPPTGGAP